MYSYKASHTLYFFFTLIDHDVWFLYNTFYSHIYYNVYYYKCKLFYGINLMINT